MRSVIMALLLVPASTQAQAPTRLHAEIDRRAKELDPLSAPASLGLASALYSAGHLDEALAELDKLRDVTPMLPPVMAGLAQLRLARGDTEKALELARQAFGMLEHLLGVEEGETFVRAVLAEVLDRLERNDEAKQILDQTARRLLARAEKLKDPTLRAAFLWQQPDNARVLAAAEAHGFELPPAVEPRHAGHL